MLAPDLLDLLTRCRHREPAAQRALYARFARPMLGVCLQYVRSPEEAKDVLQDAFVKVFTHLEAFRGDGAFEAWLRRIVVSTAIDAYQRQRHYRQQEAVEDYHHLPTPDANVLDCLSLAEVQTLIDRLAPGARMVLLLYAVEGYSHAEIGQLLGCSESSSKAQLTRARQRLAELVRLHERERLARPATTAEPPGRAALAGTTSPDATLRPAAAPEAPQLPFNPIAALLFQ